MGTDAGDLGLPVPPFQLAQQRSTRPREGQSAGTSIRNCRRPRVPPCGNGKLGTGGRDSGQRWPPTCWQRRIAGTPSTAVGARVRLLGRWQSVPVRVCAGLRMLALEHGAERSTTVRVQAVAAAEANVVAAAPAGAATAAITTALGQAVSACELRRERLVPMEAVQPSFVVPPSLAAGSWATKLPSFWCAALPTKVASQRLFLVREEHAAKFIEEFPDCVGSNILSVGLTVEKATLDAKLVTSEPPVGAIRNTQAARPQRFVNERVRLTEAGVADLARGVRKKLIVWGLRYRCGGINTYVCESSTAISATPDATTQLVGRSIVTGTTVVATDTKEVTGKTWIRVGPGWACCVDTHTGVIKLRAAGCKRQCGGTCACAVDCQKQVKKRHC